MKRLIAVAAVAVALLAPARSAYAVGSKTFDFCGGTYSGYTGAAFCASVTVGVAAATEPGHATGAYTVTMNVANLSGTNGSYAGTLFAQLGLDNVVNNVASPTNLTIAQGGNIVCTNRADLMTGKAQCYNVQVDKSVAGGVNLDLTLTTSSGVNLAIASACSGPPYYLYTCDSSNPVTITFDVTSDFDPNSGVQVYVKGQGTQYNSTECETQTSGPIACTSVTTTPEPGTLVLFASGFAGLGIPVVRRRRRNPKQLG